MQRKTILVTFVTCIALDYELTATPPRKQVKVCGKIYDSRGGTW